MEVYSHSRIETFKQCRYKYKLRYIDKVKVKVPTTVEAFMGSCVHSALEWLYNTIKEFGRTPSKEEMLNRYISEWNNNWSDDILIVRKDTSREDYQRKGEMLLAKYYERYSPFNQRRIVEVETKERIRLSDEHGYHIRIDRLDVKGDTCYVCDYKTSSRLKTQEEADKDMQLAMYALWVKQHLGSCSRVKLVWYLLPFNREVVSERSDEELEEAKRKTEEAIKMIESATDFSPNPSRLCDWCEYKELCPLFSHKSEADDNADDEGSLLVERYAELIEKESRTKKEIEEVKKKLIEFAASKGIKAVYGESGRVLISKTDYPVIKEELKEELKRALVQRGLINALDISARRLETAIDDADKELKELIKRCIEVRESRRVTFSKKRE